MAPRDVGAGLAEWAHAGRQRDLFPETLAAVRLLDYQGRAVARAIGMHVQYVGPLFVGAGGTGGLDPSLWPGPGVGLGSIQVSGTIEAIFDSTRAFERYREGQERLRESIRELCRGLLECDRAAARSPKGQAEDRRRRILGRRVWEVERRPTSEVGIINHPLLPGRFMLGLRLGLR